MLHGIYFLVSLIFLFLVPGLHGENPSALRSQGDKEFINGDIDKALRLFSKVIQIEPNNERNYYKRFRVYLRSRKYVLALNDLSTALKINDKYKQGYLQRGKLNLLMGRCEDAAQDFTSFEKLSPGESSVVEDQSKAEECLVQLDVAYKAQTKQDYEGAYAALSSILDNIALSSETLLLERAQLSFALNNLYDTIADSGRALKLDSNLMPALLLRGKAYYMLGDRQSLEAALEHFRQGLHSDPEHKDMKRQYRLVKKLLKFMVNSEVAIEKKQYNDALEDLQLAVEVDKNHAVVVKSLLVQICKCHVKLHHIEEGKSACEQVLQIDDGIALVHALLGELYMFAEDFEQAVEKYKKAKELDEGNHEIEQEYQKAQVALKQSKTKDYYKILGISRNANERAIKKAYRKKALEWHPDKHSEGDMKDKAVKEFQNVAEAYEILSNEESRQKYDRGEDVTGKNEGQGGGHRSPFGHSFFQQGGQTFTFHFG